MNNSSLLRNAFNAVAYASVFAHWAAHAICLGIALPRAGVTGGVFYGAFAAGGCLAIVSNRFFGRLSSNVAISILAAIATIGAALAHFALNAENVARIPLLLGLFLSGCGAMALIAHLNARILRDAANAKHVPLIASAGTCAWIAVNWTINSEGTNFFLWSTLATGALSIFCINRTAFLRRRSRNDRKIRFRRRDADLSLNNRPYPDGLRDAFLGQRGQYDAIVFDLRCLRQFNRGDLYL